MNIQASHHTTCRNTSLEQLFHLWRPWTDLDYYDGRIPPLPKHIDIFQIVLAFTFKKLQPRGTLILVGVNIIKAAHYSWAFLRTLECVCQKIHLKDVRLKTHLLYCYYFSLRVVFVLKKKNGKAQKQ